MRCELCPNMAMKTPHHIYTRGAHGKAAMVPENEIPLCFAHHTQAHSLGRDTFAARYGLGNRFERAREAVTLASLEASNNPCSVQLSRSEVGNGVDLTR